MVAPSRRLGSMDRRKEKQEQRIHRSVLRRLAQQEERKIELMIEVVGQLLKYTRLDNAISPFEAIWKRDAAREKGKKQEGDQRRRVETNHVIPSSVSSCMHAYIW